MTDKATLLALADRVEAMGGPCFGTEDDIEKATGQKWRFPPPNYTTSIDAAMTLVRDGWSFTIQNKFAELRHPTLRQHDTTGFAATPARALTAAALRALVKDAQ